MEGHPPRVQEPAQFLVEFIHLLPKGKALDIAMGSGRNALYLAAQGFEVEGLEKDQEAIEACLHEAEARRLKVSARRVDLEEDPNLPVGYDLILCFYYLQRSLIPQIKAALRPGGMVVYETFLIDQHLRFGHPRHRDYCWNHNELLDSFRDFHILFYREGMIAEEKIVAQIIAQKIAD